jgi:hypothetical protein
VAGRHPLFDPAKDKLYIRGRENYTGIADDDDAHVSALTVEQLQADPKCKAAAPSLRNWRTRCRTPFS